VAGVVSTFVSQDNLPDYTEPPFVWGSKTTVKSRLSSCRIADATDTGFKTATVEYRALSPQSFWRRTATSSGVFSEALRAVDDGEVSELDERMADTVDSHFNEGRNVVELEYLLTKTTVV